MVIAFLFNIRLCYLPFLYVHVHAIHVHIKCNPIHMTDRGCSNIHDNLPGWDVNYVVYACLQVSSNTNYPCRALNVLLLVRGT